MQKLGRRPEVKVCCFKDDVFKVIALFVGGESEVTSPGSPIQKVLDVLGETRGFQGEKEFEETDVIPHEIDGGEASSAGCLKEL